MRSLKYDKRILRAKCRIIDHSMNPHFNFYSFRSIESKFNQTELSSNHLKMYKNTIFRFELNFIAGLFHNKNNAAFTLLCLYKNKWNTRQRLLIVIFLNKERCSDKI